MEEASALGDGDMAVSDLPEVVEESGTGGQTQILDEPREILRLGLQEPPFQRHAGQPAGERVGKGGSKHGQKRGGHQEAPSELAFGG